MSTDPKKDMYDHSYPESLNVAWDQFRTFEDSIRTFCSHMECTECPFFKYVPKDVAMPADACPTLEHLRDLRRILATESMNSAMPDVSKGPEDLRNLYRVPWVENQQVFFKGFDEDLSCRGMQYEVGKTFHVDGPLMLCRNGLHYCASILEMLDFYPIPWSRYCEIEVPVGARIEKSSMTVETKSCATDITLLREVKLSDLVRKLDKPKAGYRFDIGVWHSENTITVQTCWALYWCNSPVSVNDAYYSTVHAQGYIGVANVANSAVVMEWDSALAVARGDSSVAYTKGANSVAVALQYRAISMTDGPRSVAVAQDVDSTAIVASYNSVGVALRGRGSFIRLEAPYTTAVGNAHVVVTAKHCAVIIPAYLDDGCFSLWAVEGTLIVWFGAKVEAPVMAVVGKDNAIKPETHYMYGNLVSLLLGGRPERLTENDLKE